VEVHILHNVSGLTVLILLVFKCWYI